MKDTIGFKPETKLVSRKNLIQVHLKISSRTLENLASHLMTKYITCSIFAMKLVIHITNAIVWQQNCEQMHIVKSKGTNRVFCISLEWFNNAVSGKEIVVGLQLTQKMHFRVTVARPMFNRVFRVQRNDPVKNGTAADLQFAEEHLVSDDMKSDGL